MIGMGLEEMVSEHKFVECCYNCSNVCFIVNTGKYLCGAKEINLNYADEVFAFEWCEDYSNSCETTLVSPRYL